MCEDDPLLQYPRINAKIANMTELDSKEFMMKFWKYIMKEIYVVSDYH